MEAAFNNDEQELKRELWERDRKIIHLSKSKDELAEQVHQLKALVKDAHTRYEEDIQLTVASLQDQYNAAVELLQVGAGLSTGAGPASCHAPELPREPPPPPLRGAASMHPPRPHPQDPLPSAQRTAYHQQQPSQPRQRQPPLSQHPLPRRHGCAATGCRCPPAGASVPAPAPRAQQAPTPATGTRGAQRPKGAAAATTHDPRYGILGLDPDDFGPSAAFGASVGLVTEPLAVLRDVLNLDGAADREREQLVLQGRQQAAAAGGAVGVMGPMLAQAQFESRLRGAYRSMLLQLQHRYQLERERQEDAHKTELQDQEERHSEVMSELAARHQAEMAEVGSRLEQEAAARRADVQRLEAHLAAAKAAAETSQSQAAAARAAAEALQAQLQLLRTTHEAELQHVRQGSIPLQQHEEIVQRLKAEWDAALQQRERDFGALLDEVAGLRRQLSSAAEPSRSSGHSCGRGSTAVSRPESASTAVQQLIAAAPLPRSPARPATAGPAPATGASRGPQHGSSGSAVRSSQGAPSQGPGRPHIQHRSTGPRTQGSVPGSRRPEQRVADHTGGPEGYDAAHGSLAPGGAGAHRSCVAEAPGSPAPSGYSVALSLDENGNAILDVSEETATAAAADAASTPHSRAYPLPLQGEDAVRPASSASSRLSDLVDAIVYGNSKNVSSHTSYRGGSVTVAEHGRRADNTSRADDRDGSNDVGRRSAGAPAGAGCHSADNTEGYAEGGGGGLGSFGGWLPQQHTGQAWAGCDDGGNGRPGSAEYHSSEVTFDRWQVKEPQPGLEDDVTERGGPQARSRAGVSCGGVTSDDVGWPAGRRSAPSRSPSPPTRPSQPAPHSKHCHDEGRQQERHQPGLGTARAPGVDWGAAARGGGGMLRDEPRAGSPTSPVRLAVRGGKGSDREPQGAPPEWGRVPAAAAPPAVGSSLRCLRCGQNDDTSPGVCRFHPALLADPGALRFTPEWMACHAADHTARTRGCFARSEHFYDPGGALAAVGLQERLRTSTGAGAQGLPGGAPGRAGAGGGTVGTQHCRAYSPPSSPPPVGSGAGRASAAAAEVGGFRSWGVFSQKLGVDGNLGVAAESVGGATQGSGQGIRRVAWGGVSTSPPRPGPGQAYKAGVSGAGAGGGGVGAGKVRVAPRARAGSPGRAAIGREVAAATAAAAAAAAISGDSSPSPKPRTRLPSPARR